MGTNIGAQLIGILYAPLNVSPENVLVNDFTIVFTGIPPFPT